VVKSTKIIHAQLLLPYNEKLGVVRTVPLPDGNRRLLEIRRQRVCTSFGHATGQLLFNREKRKTCEQGLIHKGLLPVYAGAIHVRRAKKFLP